MTSGQNRCYTTFPEGFPQYIEIIVYVLCSLWGFFFFFFHFCARQVVQMNRDGIWKGKRKKKKKLLVKPVQYLFNFCCGKMHVCCNSFLKNNKDFFFFFFKKVGSLYISMSMCLLFIVQTWSSVDDVDRLALV